MTIQTYAVSGENVIAADKMMKKKEKKKGKKGSKNKP